MRNIPALLLSLLLCGALAGCGGAPAEEPAADTWDCTVTCAEASEENAYVITYSEAAVVSVSGRLTAENANEFPVTVHLSAAGEGEQTLQLDPGETAGFEAVSRDRTYTVGLHADVPENTEIRVTVSDPAA